jgi:NADPH2 dehydrogenase
VVDAVGQKNAAFRFSPWGTYLGASTSTFFVIILAAPTDMRFDDPKLTYTYLVSELHDRYPELAYLHVVEPRVDGSQTVEVPLRPPLSKRESPRFPRPS